MTEKSRPAGNRLYRALAGRLPRVTPKIHLILFPVALAALDLGFRHIYRFTNVVGEETTRKLLPFTLGWVLVFTAVAALLPRRVRQVFMAVLGLSAGLLCVVHGVYINMFRRFFSFSDLAFAGDGVAFMDVSYLILRKALLLWVLLCLTLVALSVLLTPPDVKRFPVPEIVTGVLGVILILITRFTVLGSSGAVVWNETADPAFLYEDFSDSRACLSMLGIYQYTFRDIQMQMPRRASLSAGELSEIDVYTADRTHEDNGMSGLLEGKNLILIQLEAIDTWMLEEYMPALRGVKENSVVFANHYTPAYITAGTFNTEFMVNAGLLPAVAGVSPSVYSQNRFPNSLAWLFRKKGYTANSFHGSEGEVYNRGVIHLNFGYEAYHSGTDMDMPDFTMDSQMISAFNEMVSDGPFFTFIITYSGHGPYGESDPTYLAHKEEALAEAARTDGNYVYAVAHAKETDVFIGELMEALEASGHLDDTAVVFYADHYNYYMLDDDLNMDIKGVDSLNMLAHTDFFICSRDLEPRTVEKYTSSLDVLPTLANLFGLDAQYELLTGDDAFSDAGGYVFFNDNTWVGSDEDLAQEITRRRRISGLLLAGNYWVEQG